jgi:hypothetical protein
MRKIAFLVGLTADEHGAKHNIRRRRKSLTKPASKISAWVFQFNNKIELKTYQQDLWCIKIDFQAL